MSKKSTKELKLTAEEYWEWKFNLEFWARRKAELVSAELEAKVMSLEYQSKILELRLHTKTRLESAKKSVENSFGDYQTTKAKIESRLGISLNGKAINEFTFEVVEIPETNNTQE